MLGLGVVASEKDGRNILKMKEERDERWFEEITDIFEKHGKGMCAL